MMFLDLEAAGRGERETAGESTALADEHVPSASTRIATSCFELLEVRRVASELIASAPAGRDSNVARTLVDDADMTVSIVALRRGQGTGEHATPHSTVIVPISGRVRFATGNGIVDLTPGRFMFVDPDRRHEIVADEDAAVMLVVAKQQRATPLRAAGFRG
jgi:quercetin dioxygenase-like cupin family protein